VSKSDKENKFQNKYKKNEHSNQAKEKSTTQNAFEKHFIEKQAIFEPNNLHKLPIFIQLLIK
jgi:hypothetical protein